MSRLFTIICLCSSRGKKARLEKSGCKDTELMRELLAGSGVCVNNCSLVKEEGNNTVKFEMNFCMFELGY